MQTEGGLNVRTLFTQSLETQLIVDALRKAGGYITYDELSQIARVDVRREGYGNLLSARQILRREDRVVWGVDRGKGLVRLSSGGIVEAGVSYRTRIHNAARRGLETLECVDYSKLSNEEKISFSAEAAAMGAVHVMSSSRGAKRLEAAAARSSEKLSLGETLRVFGAAS